MSTSTLIKQQLVDAGVFTRVQGAANLAIAIERRQFAGADAYVVLSNVKADPNHLVNAVSQRLTETYSVIFWTSVAGDPTGDAVIDQVEAKRALIMNALLGWEPDADHSPMHFAGGVLSRFESGAVLWEDSFTTESYLRAT